MTFQSASEPTSGVANVAPRANVPFNRRNELASDVIWISDATQAINAQNFRASSFLRSTTGQIAGDLGVSLTDSVDGLPKVAETVSRVRDIAAHAYPWTDFSTDWSHASFPTCIAKILPATGEIPDGMESPLRQAFQSFSFVPDQPYADGNAQTVYTLRANRLRYAQYICATKIPTNQWIGVRDMSSSNLTLDDFLDPDAPSLVEASIEFTTGLNEAVTPALTAFGSTQAMGRQPIRKWISQIELAWLVNHANVHITAGFIGQAKPVSLSEQHALPAILTADPVYALSIAAGLVAECHWVGLASKTSIRRAGNSATAKFVDIVSPMNVWLRAADRAYCFAMAKIVAENGFNVVRYGYGSVSFYGPKNDIGRIVALADVLGTCHPCLSAVEKRMYVGSEGELSEVGI